MKSINERKIVLEIIIFEEFFVWIDNVIMLICDDNIEWMFYVIGVVVIVLMIFKCYFVIIMNFVIVID